MNIYVGNLSWEATDDDLRAEFEAFGRVSSASVIKDKLSNRSRGFGFVEMESAAEAQAAIKAMNGKEFKGRALTVNEARPRTERRDR
jgi:RNA recognition motif-containing protein